MNFFKLGLLVDLYLKEVISVFYVEVIDDNKLDGGKLSWKFFVINSFFIVFDFIINYNFVSFVEKKVVL